MKISIITICFNDAVGLRKTAQSVVNQKDVEYEWVIIDGDSTDGSKNVIVEFSDYVDFWVSEPDSGIYNAMNKGLNHVHGDYVLFLNSGDCLLHNHVLSEVMCFLDGKDLYIGDICHDNDKNCSACYRLPPKITDEQIVYQLTHFTFPHPASFFRSDFFSLYGYFDEKMRIVSDWKLFFIAAIIKNATIETIPIVVTIFDVNGISSIDPNVMVERDKALEKMPRLKVLSDFYVSNYEIVAAVRATKIGRFIVRGYFYLYRLLHTKR